LKVIPGLTSTTGQIIPACLVCAPE